MSAMTLSDLELARLEHPGTPDAQLVVQLAQRTLDELPMEPPINHEIVASLRDVIRIEEAPIPWSGFLAHTDDGLVITLRESDSDGRKRFTVFHEVMHTFLPGFGTQVQYRCDPTLAVPDATQFRDPALESLCDLGAAELLFPQPHFLADLAGNPATFTLVEELAARYDASVEATARRVVSLHPTRTLLLVLTLGCKPSEPNARPQLRVQSAQAGGRWPYVPRYKSVPDDGIFGRALRGEMIDEIVSSLGTLTSNAITDVQVSARLYPYIDDRGEQHMRVLALITPTTSRRSRNAS
jgi:hypothetical protein